MSHIPGHVITEPNSFGELSLDYDSSVIISFLPPPSFRLKVGDPVGFHPIFSDSGHTTIVGFNVFDLALHDMTESLAAINLPGLGKIETIYKDVAKKARVVNLIGQGKIEKKYCDVLERILDYFNFPDFATFYVKPSSTSTRNAEKMVADIYHRYHP